MKVLYFGLTFGFWSASCSICPYKSHAMGLILCKYEFSVVTAIQVASVPCLYFGVLFSNFVLIVRSRANALSIGIASRAALPNIFPQHIESEDLSQHTPGGNIFSELHSTAQLLGSFVPSATTLCEAWQSPV